MDFLVTLLIFGIVVLAAGQIGKFCTSFRLPLITGFLLAGIVAGPFALKIVSKENLIELEFINHLALAVIAMAAGSELVLKEFRSRFRSITWITIGLVVVTFSLGATATFLLSSVIPFMAELEINTRLAISVMMGVILVARSPSSAIAIINELRAKGPFTQTVLGVTVVMDAVVIVLFAIGSEFAHAAITPDFSLSFGFLGLLILEIGLSLIGGVLLWLIVAFIVPLSVPRPIKSVLLLLVGFSVFVLSDHLQEYSLAAWKIEIFIEPLLLCMIAGLLVSNTSPHRVEFARILKQVGPPIYLAFFTLTGIFIDLEVLVQNWHLALVLFAVRLVGIFIGTFSGALIAGDPPKHRSIGWMGFVTQAGIGIGLARKIGSEFDVWGPQVATLLIAVIVFNQLIGPPLMKWAIVITKECRTRANTPAFDGVMDAVVFGTAAGQSWMLAHRLEAHGWNIKLATLDDHTPAKEVDSDIEVIRLADLSVESFEALELSHADAIIALLSDAENLQICQLNYDKFGIERMVVKLDDNTTELEPFRELEALVVDSKTAMVSLLEHFVLSPTGTSMLLGLKSDQDVLEIELRDADLHGLFIRDLKLPLDVLVMAVTRDGKVVITHGFNRLRLGDRLTILGPPESLSEALLYFDA